MKDTARRMAADETLLVETAEHLELQNTLGVSHSPECLFLLRRSY